MRCVRRHVALVILSLFTMRLMRIAIDAAHDVFRYIFAQRQAHSQLIASLPTHDTLPVIVASSTGPSASVCIERLIAFQPCKLTPTCCEARTKCGCKPHSVLIRSKPHAVKACKPHSVKCLPAVEGNFNIYQDDDGPYPYDNFFANKKYVEYFPTRNTSDQPAPESDRSGNSRNLPPDELLEERNYWQSLRADG